MLNPHNWMTLTALSGVYLRLGAVELAKQTIEQARLIEPKQASVILLQGDIFREDREYEFAGDAYRQALAIDPSLVTAAIGLGWCLADLGEYRQAAEVFESLIQRGIPLVEPLRALASLPATAVRIDLLSQLDRVHRQQDESAAQLKERLRSSARRDLIGPAAMRSPGSKPCRPTAKFSFPCRRASNGSMSDGAQVSGPSTSIAGIANFAAVAMMGSRSRCLSLGRREPARPQWKSL